MTAAQERVIKAAIALSDAGRGILDAGRLPSAVIHEIYDAVRILADEATLGATGKFPQGRLDEHDEGELKMMISHDDKLVRFDFGTPTAWIAMPKPQALTFAFTILEHCGVKIEHQIQQDPAKGEPA